MEQLFNGKIKPITTRMACIKGDINYMINKFVEWQLPLIVEHKNTFNKALLNENVLLQLCPLTTTERRKYLFIPTQSPWIAFFDNGHTGTDRTIPEVLSKILNTECIYVGFDVDTGETVLDIFGPTNNDATDLVRSIAVIKESGWKFYQYGQPLPFERQEMYKERIIKNRFNHTVLTGYLKQMEIAIYNEAFYDSQRAVLLTKHGPKFENTRELSLKQAQAFFTGV